MKKLNRINLHKLSQAELAKREEKLLKGGNQAKTPCISMCLCAYAGESQGDNDSYYGGSSTEDNDKANSDLIFNGNNQ